MEATGDSLFISDAKLPPFYNSTWVNIAHVKDLWEAEKQICGGGYNQEFIKHLLLVHKAFCANYCEAGNLKPKIEKRSESVDSTDVPVQQPLEEHVDRDNVGGSSNGCDDGQYDSDTDIDTDIDEYEGNSYASTDIETYTVVKPSYQTTKFTLCREEATKPSELKTHLLTDTDTKGHAPTKKAKPNGPSDVDSRPVDNNPTNSSGRQKQTIKEESIDSDVDIDKPHICHQCEKGFTKLFELKKHLKLHREQKQLHECTKCSRFFKLDSSLQRHMKMHKVEDGKEANENICSDCGKRCCTPRALKKHRMKYCPVTKAQYKCPKCDKQFRARGGLKLHLMTHTGERPYLCSKCGKRFIRQTELNKHMNKHTGENLHHCSVCGKSFTQLYNLEMHSRRHTGEKPHLCCKCGRGFSQAHNLARHMLQHSDYRPFPCTYCEKGFTQRALLQAHVSTHTGMKAHTCAECGKGFHQLPNLKEHLKGHAGGTVNACTICGKSDFATIKTLRAHILLHKKGDKKSHVCSYCSKAFKQMGTLTAHLRVHTGEKFNCPKCGKGFTWKQSLISHVATHTGVKDHICSDCGKAFNQVRNLTRHRLTHTGERPYVCSQCGKAYSQSGNLKIHMRLHTGERPYLCPECGKGFVESGSLRKHMTTHKEPSVKLEQTMLYSQVQQLH